MFPPFGKGGLGGIYPTMIKCNPKLKEEAQRLRAQMTHSERAMWARRRRKQVLSVQFYTQKPIGNYIVDFYAPKAKLVVEVDGSQHIRLPTMRSPPQSPGPYPASKPTIYLRTSWRWLMRLQLSTRRLQ